MRNLKFLSLILLVSVVISCLTQVPAQALAEPSVNANAVVLVDTVSGDILYSRNADMGVYPASLTKIMTVLLAAEAIDDGRVSPDDMVTASENCTYDLISDGSTANIVPGETMTLRDLMYCALVVSANEACNIIAEYIGGSIDEFIVMMNERAVSLGCAGTKFSNTHGLPDPEHYTTARDMAIISQEALNHELFMTICGTHEIEILPTNMTEEPRILVNTNALLGDNDYYEGYTYEYAMGMKTGHTEDAGYCLVSTAIKDDISCLAVVMGAEAIRREDRSIDIGSFSDSITLYNWVFENFSYQNVMDFYDCSSITVPVTMGSDADSVPVSPAGTLSLLLPNDATFEEFEFTPNIYSVQQKTKVKAPVSKGDVLGDISVSRNGVSVGSVKLEAASAIDLSKAVFMRSQVAQVFSLPFVKIAIVALFVLFALYLFLIMRYKVLRKRYLLSLKRALKEREAMKQGNFLQMDEFYFQDEEPEIEPSPSSEPQYATAQSRAGAPSQAATPQAPPQRQQRPQPGQAPRYPRPYAPSGTPGTRNPISSGRPVQGARPAQAPRPQQAAPPPGYNRTAYHNRPAAQPGSQGRYPRPPQGSGFGAPYNGNRQPSNDDRQNNDDNQGYFK